MLGSSLGGFTLLLHLMAAPLGPVGSRTEEGGSQEMGVSSRACKGPLCPGHF